MVDNCYGEFVEKIEPSDGIIVQNDDMGMVIGRNGKMISALRVLIQAAAYNMGLQRIRINVDSF